MDVQRSVLLIALAVVLMFLWQAWLEHERSKLPAPAQRPAPAGAPAVPGALPPVAVEGDVPDVPTAKEIVRGAGPADEAAEPEAAGQQLIVETDLMKVGIDTVGGELRSVSLLGYPVSVDRPDEPFALMKDDGVDIFVGQTGLIGSGREYPSHKVTFRADQSRFRLPDGEDTLRVPLRWTAPDGVEYTKTFTFRRDSYLIDIEFDVVNASASDWTGYLYAQFQRTQIVEDRGGLAFVQALPSYKGGAIYTPEERYEKIGFDDMQDADLERNSASGWVAMLQHYFVGAWLVEPQGAYQFYSRVLSRATAPRYNLGYKTLQPLLVDAGDSGRVGTRLYIGPKEQDRLKQPAEGLILTVDYGWLTPIASPLFWILNAIHKVVGNWGWAIILLTLLIKLIFYPLSAASYKSMAKMKKLQPRLKTLKERYGDDRQKLNQAMMELYKKDKINPLGGCLPIVIQIPVFIALYWVLLESVELRQASWIMWLDDLSLPDPYYVLPILMGASMFGQQLLNPAPLDPIQKKVMMALPVVFTVFFLWFPAGLVLYWLVNNVLSIAQQWYITHSLQEKGS